MLTTLKDLPAFKKLLTPSLCHLNDLLSKYGHEVRMAGGVVRDLLNGVSPSDVDLATTATPSETLQILHENKIRTLNELGLKHGTVTARIGEENIEITTTRIDTNSDGRRCDVIFTKEWKLDALRRDLTINSMFLDFQGNLYDYFEGQKHLKEKKVIFVGNSEERIREDYLRILRYFRFFGRIAQDPESHDEQTLQVISKNVEGLRNISGERIWMELYKILSNPFGGPLTLKMLSLGLGPYIGLPKTPNTKRFNQIMIRSTLLHPVTLLSALLDSENDVKQLHERLRFSAIQRDLGYFVVKHRNEILETLPHWKSILIDASKPKAKDIRFYIQETLLSQFRDDLAKEISEWILPVFPIKGGDLLAAGCSKGKSMSLILFQLKDLWKNSNYNLSREELLKQLPSILDDLEAFRIKSR